ncbi:MAG: DASS family sodium-coupled anion symporter [Armatimonadetes bacterium]|nr:DASS family sodium-coupled anion symporter [Armatimonadota bacterium]
MAHAVPHHAPPPVDVLRMVRREAVDRLWKLTACLAVAALVLLVPTTVLTPPQRTTAFIFAFAAGLWVTEAIPLFATSLLLVALEILLLALPGQVLSLSKPDSYKVFFAAAADPIVALFFGGFMLARAATRYKLDIALARVFLKPFGTRPAMVLLGVMSITAAFAMWMTNTASTAMMLAIIAPMLDRLDEDDRFRKALVLGVPFGGSFGCIGTPIGTPPNAVAVAVLRQHGYDISFLEWMKAAVPLMLLMLLLGWLLLYATFPPKQRRIEFALPAGFRLPLTAYVVAAVFFITVALWMTSELHHIPPSVVALLPAAVFSTLCILETDDVNSIQWSSLILIAGGIALGIAIRETQLDLWLLDHLPLRGASPYMVVGAAALAALALASVMSHTAAANLVLPIVASAGSPDLSHVWVVLVATMATAFAMGLPISTPPNALAYATGEITTRDLLRTGGVIAVGGTALVVVTGRAVLAAWGLLD